MEQRLSDSEPTARNSLGAGRRQADAQAQRVAAAEPPRQTIPGHLAAGSPRREILHEALAAAWAEHRAQAQRFEAAKAQLQAIAEWIETGRPQQEVLRESAFARMRARLESLPVIEQAKGILMAQQRCGPEEAFDLLRRASQRANVRVHVLAAQIVAQVAAPRADASVQPPKTAAK